MKGKLESAGSDAWVSSAGVSPEAMETVQNALPIRLIATSRSAFKTCRVEDNLACVVGENAKREAPFDHLPVVDGAEDGRETIAGVLDLTPFRSDRSAQGIVNDRMDRLSEDILIGADADILAFVRNADRYPCQLVVSGPEISGLVTLSDLQKLPVRVALFAAITHAEMAVAEAIRRELNGSDKWQERLKDNRRENILKEINKSVAEDTLIDHLLFTQFCDKRDIICNSPRFKGSKTKFRNEMKKIEDLRNRLAHANNYTSTRTAAEGVCQTVRSIDTWIRWLTKWPAAGPNVIRDGGA